MNDEIVRSYCDAWVRGDTPAIVGHYHEDLTLRWPGCHRLAGTHRGLDAALTALLELQTSTNRVPERIVDVASGDRSVVVIVDERWADERRSIELRRALEFTVADDQLHSCQIYETDQAAVDAWIGSATAP